MIARVASAARSRPAAAMAVATAFSRGTGFARTLALAWALGVTTLADAYNVANTAPNMLFQLAAGGVLSSAVVPLLTQSSTDDERRDNANVLFGSVLVVGVMASLVLAASAPLIIRALTAGAVGRADSEAIVRVGTLWLVIFAPQVLAYAVSVFSVGVLTSRSRLFLGAAAPVTTNILMLVGVVAFVLVGGRRPGVGAVTDSAVVWLGGLTTAGVVVMAVIQYVGARRIEPGLRPRFVVRHPAIRRAAGIAPWVALYVGVNQAGLAFVVSFASSIPGGISAYQWAFTVMQLPYALIGVSILTAAFPRMSASATSDPAATNLAVNRALARTMQLLLPVAGILAGAAPLLAVALVGRSGDMLVAAGIAGFAVSLGPFSAFQLFTRASYAFRDARSPALVNIAVNVVNVAFDVVILMVVEGDRGRVAGLALGHAASYVVGVLLLSRQLRVRHGVRVAVAPRALLASAVIALAGAGAFLVVQLAWQPRSQLAAGLGVLGLVSTAAGAAALPRLRRRTSAT